MSKDIILKELKQIEKENKVRIIFAVESGSRAWGISSKDSDNDVRFVFVRTKDEYLALDKKPDVIDIDKHLPERDYVGFDIYKFLQYLRNSNPSVIEWLFSPIVYINEFQKFDEMQKEISNNFNPKALFYHYKSMSKSNYVKYLQSGNLVTYKKYLYAMRGLLNAMWVLKHNTIPPIIFPDTINEINPITKKGDFLNISEVKEIVPNWVLKKVSDIIYLKKQGKEKDIIENIVHIDQYIESFLKSNEEPDSRKKFDIRIFNDILKENL